MKLVCNVNMLYSIQTTQTNKSNAFSIRFYFRMYYMYGIVMMGSIYRPVSFWPNELTFALRVESCHYRHVTTF